MQGAQAVAGYVPYREISIIVATLQVYELIDSDAAVRVLAK